MSAKILILALSFAVQAGAAAAARRVLPADTLVRVKVLATLESRTASVGDRFPYVVAEDVVHNGRVWIRRGTSGKGFLTKVKRAGRFGQNGRLVAAFGKIRTVSGRLVTLTISKKASQYNDRDKLAAGASFLGLVALGPLGLAGGAFVKGENVTIHKHAELYVSTEEAVH